MSHLVPQVNSKTGTPINSIIAMCLAAIVLGLPYLGSDVAFTAISSKHPVSPTAGRPLLAAALQQA